MADPLSHVFSPLQVGGRTIHNRVLLAPMSVGYAAPDGTATRRMAEHYGRRAKSGIGMVITENVAINAAGRQMPLQPMLADEAAVHSFAMVAEEIRKHGALAIMQIVHAGRYAGPWDQWHAVPRLAPSAVAFPLLPDRVVTPTAISAEEIAATVEAFANTARLAERAGFDGVDVHGAQGFLISSFLSPRMNRRADVYGGDFSGRTRFLREVISALRASVSFSFIVGLHLMSDELVDGGWQLADSLKLVCDLGGSGLDFIIPVASTFETMRLARNAGLMTRPLFQHDQTRSIAAATKLPVFANGGFRDLWTIERTIAAGEAAAVGLARPIFADPDWLVHASQIPDAIRRCGCATMLCLRTQLTGSLCESWPQGVKERGYLGYDRSQRSGQEQDIFD